MGVRKWAAHNTMGENRAVDADRVKQHMRHIIGFLVANMQNIAVLQHEVDVTVAGVARASQGEICSCGLRELDMVSVGAPTVCNLQCIIQCQMDPMAVVRDVRLDEALQGAGE